MTYCLAIKLDDGIIFASDSRTNAGVDHVSSYSKMHAFSLSDDRFFLLLSAGNLATTQAVVNTIQRDLDDPSVERNLNTVEQMFDAAGYIGQLSERVQAEHAKSLERNNINAEASFIIGGQINGHAHEIFLIYPQGNYISPPPATPFLQIGETKYGKPILDRFIHPTTNLENAARCALISLDSTMRSNISVGPPIELTVYRRDTLKVSHRQIFEPDEELYCHLRRQWSEGLHDLFHKLPRFSWEEAGSPDT